MAYLKAIIWRLRGLRVRARNQLAALMGQSPHAYSLWMERNDGGAFDRLSAQDTTVIWPVIDCRDGSAGIDGTLTSLIAAGWPASPTLIGTSGSNACRLVARPQDLANLLPDHESWLLPMRPGDRVAIGSFAPYSKAAAQAGNCRLIYADDDLIDSEGKRHSPHLKPGWNPELFEHHDFVSLSSIVRCSRKLLREMPDRPWVESLVRHALTDGAPPLKVHGVLHHRDQRPSPKVPAKPSSMPPLPAATVIIPTRNHHELLKNCVEGLWQTAYPKLTLIIVDNGSDECRTLDYLAELQSRSVTVLRIPGSFNYSSLNNAAVKHADADLLCFLNNDVEITDPDWLALLAQHATKPHIGAVGARLLYPDGTIQHAGVFTGIGGGAGHAHRFQRRDELGYFARALLPQRVSAVTGACMVVAREKFVAVGGFDEQQFPVAFNDVDLCLKLNGRGWATFYEPRAALIHHESKSRGRDKSKSKRARFAGELAALKRVWDTDKLCDPYHHPHLSPFCEQFLIGL